jgi:ferritin
LNEQIAKEAYSSYLYLSMAGFFENQTLPGMAKWMRVQAQEESCHVLMFFNYVCEQGSVPVLGALPAPPAGFKSAQDVFQHTVDHERKVTDFINKLMDLALDLRDHATKQFLEWFVKEQVEEEASAGAMLQQVQRVKEGQALFVLDKDAGTRIFAVPVPLVGKI